MWSGCNGGDLISCLSSYSLLPHPMFPLFDISCSRETNLNEYKKNNLTTTALEVWSFEARKNGLNMEQNKPLILLMSLYFSNKLFIVRYSILYYNVFCWSCVNIVLHINCYLNNTSHTTYTVLVFTVNSCIFLSFLRNKWAVPIILKLKLKKTLPRHNA